MASNSLALAALESAIQTVLDSGNRAGTISAPGQIYRGWPTATKLSEIFGQPSAQAMVSIWPLKGRSTTRYAPVSYVVSPFTVGVTASLNTGHTQLTIGGTPNAGEVVHAFFGHPQSDAGIEIANGDSTAAVATKVAAAITALAVSGVTASAVGSVVTISGALFTAVNVGGTSTMQREVARMERLVQVTVWANNPTARDQISDALQANIGTTVQPFITASDGTLVRCAVQSDVPNDKAESSYSSFRQDLFFTLEYGITQTISGTQVAGAQYDQTIDNISLPSQAISG